MTTRLTVQAIDRRWPTYRDCPGGTKKYVAEKINFTWLHLHILHASWRFLRFNGSFFETPSNHSWRFWKLVQNPKQHIECSRMSKLPDMKLNLKPRIVKCVQVSNSALDKSIRICILMPTAIFGSLIVCRLLDSKGCKRRCPRWGASWLCRAIFVQRTVAQWCQSCVEKV